MPHSHTGAWNPGGGHTHSWTSNNSSAPHGHRTVIAAQNAPHSHSVPTGVSTARHTHPYEFKSANAPHSHTQPLGINNAPHNHPATVTNIGSSDPVNFEPRVI
jgi:hypothetical protein